MKDINSIKFKTIFSKIFKKKITIGYFSFVVLTVTSLFFTACNQNKVGGSDQTVSADQVKIDQADSITLLISKDGHTKARLKTKQFIQNDGVNPPYLDMEDGLIVEFFDENLKVESILKARTARFYPHNNNILVKDSVVVISASGDTLKTQELVWNNQLQKFFSDVPVTISKDGSQSYGSGLEANKDLSWIRILQQRGTLPVASDQLPQD
ncbi:MAG TPA: LPS export ABC transporter periplasmic protein LptC [Edaphocola sp.]|nr:LPS export ABC transporter periplasmic protein LptC [Edaphocola sp.]